MLSQSELSRDAETSGVRTTSDLLGRQSQTPIARSDLVQRELWDRDEWKAVEIGAMT